MRPTINTLRKNTLPLLTLMLTWTLTACGGGGGDTTSATDTTNTNQDTTANQGTTTFPTIASLGERIFSDQRFSQTRNQSCASCHNPNQAFVDTRTNNVAGAVSVGDDNVSLGTRNSPTVTYAHLTPTFSGTDGNNARGGQFHDGRASSLADQAGQPFLNAVEMDMPSEAAVVARIQEDTDYTEAFQAFFGATVFDDTTTAYDALKQTLATFQATDAISPFNSKYDRALAGTYTMTATESQGMNLFFSNRTNCLACHHVNNLPQRSPAEIFTNHDYFNIGVPANTTLNTFLTNVNQQADLVANGDQGLFDNPAITNNNARGRFKVPTLRNIAVTQPYMHNGAFTNLQTVLHFYDHQGGNPARANNPETGQAWNTPEVTNNITNRLNMQNLSDNDIDVLECFLRTLTDQAYEANLPALRTGLSCS